MLVTQGAHAGDNKVDTFDIEARRGVYHRQRMRRGNAKSAPANAAGGVGVMGGTGVLVRLRKTVFSLAATILETVQNVFFLEKREGTKNGTAVDGGKMYIKFFEREGRSKFLNTFDNEQAHGRGAYTVVLQYKFVLVCFHKNDGCAKKRTCYTCKNILFSRMCSKLTGFCNCFAEI